MIQVANIGQLWPMWVYLRSNGPAPVDVLGQIDKDILRVDTLFIQLLGNLLYGTHVRIWVLAIDGGIGEQLGCRKVLLLVKRGDGHRGLANVGRNRLPGMKVAYLLARAGNRLVTWASVRGRSRTQPLPAPIVTIGEGIRRAHAPALLPHNGIRCAQFAQEVLALGGAGMADI